MYPARYYRQNKKWSSLIGKKGKVLLFTENKVRNRELQEFEKILLALVEFKDKERKLLICTEQSIEIGQEVEVVFRRIYSTANGGLINYGCKVKANN